MEAWVPGDMVVEKEAMDESAIRTLVQEYEAATSATHGARDKAIVMFAEVHPTLAAVEFLVCVENTCEGLENDEAVIFRSQMLHTWKRFLFKKTPAFIENFAFDDDIEKQLEKCLQAHTYRTFMKDKVTDYVNKYLDQLSTTSSAAAWLAAGWLQRFQVSKAKMASLEQILGLKKQHGLRKKKQKL